MTGPKDDLPMLIHFPTIFVQINVTVRQAQTAGQAIERKWDRAA
jgi:hypothetical protein